MNKQARFDRAGRLLSRGIEWTHRFGPGSGRTSNPVGGCYHGCQWQMPDGAVASCYAGAAVERMRSTTFYPHGFEHHYWHPEELETWKREKTPCGIFVGSMSDVFGHWVPDTHIQTVLAACRAAPWHVFFVLTKNAPRLLQFRFPANVWVGVSAPPSRINGQALSAAQQAAMVRRQLGVLANVEAAVRWMSIEPLSFDIAPLFAGVEPLPLEWAVIGAATHGSKVYQPDAAHLTAVLDVLDRHRIPAFFKGNLRGNPAATPWREEYPPLATVQQLALLP